MTRLREGRRREQAWLCFSLFRPPLRRPHTPPLTPRSIRTKCLFVSFTCSDKSFLAVRPLLARLFFSSDVKEPEFEKGKEVRKKKRERERRTRRPDDKRRRRKKDSARQEDIANFFSLFFQLDVPLARQSLPRSLCSLHSFLCRWVKKNKR